MKLVVFRSGLVEWIRTMYDEATRQERRRTYYKREREVVDRFMSTVEDSDYTVSEIQEIYLSTDSRYAIRNNILDSQSTTATIPDESVGLFANSFVFVTDGEEKFVTEDGTEIGF